MTTYRSPASAPPQPASPLPRSRIREPSLTPGRDLDRVALRAPLAAGAAAVRARILDHGAVAAAARARLREREEALALGHDAAARGTRGRASATCRASRPSRRTRGRPSRARPGSSSRRPGASPRRRGAPRPRGRAPRWPRCAAAARPPRPRPKSPPKMSPRSPRSKSRSRSVRRPGRRPARAVRRAERSYCLRFSGSESTS